MNHKVNNPSKTNFAKVAMKLAEMLSIPDL